VVVRVVITALLTMCVLFPSSAPCQEETKSIAVIAFENTMKNPDFEWIGIGFAETITTKLAHVKSLTVVERRQIERVLDEIELGSTGLVTDETVQEAGKIIGAQYLLIGSFQKLDAGSGSQIMVNSRIMKAETTEIFETFMIRGMFENLFDLQEQMAIKISSILDVPLSDEEKSRLAETESASLEAYEYFYRAKHTDDLDTKIDLYEKSLELDPEYVLALTNLGSLYYVKSLEGGKSMLRKARDLCLHATEIDPFHADAHHVLGAVFEKLGDEEKAAFHYQTFLTLKPDDSRRARIMRKLERLDR